MALNNKKKKKEFSFEEWSNANHGISKEQEEEDARKRQAYLAQQSADIAPVRNIGADLADSALSDPHFQTYSKLGAAVKNPSFEDATKGIGIAGWRPFADEIQNPVTYVRENEMEVRLLGNKPLDGIDFLWANMTDEEVEVYNYYLAKDGKDKAEKYLKSLEKTLSEREGKKISNNINGNSVAEVIIGGLAGVESGVKGATVGMKNLITGSEETMTPSPMQYADRMMAEDNTGFLMGAHDTASAIGNMAPSLVVGSAVGGIAGAAAMGIGVAGNKYNSMIEEGYDTDEARGSGIINGILEGASQYAMGGIGKYGGKAASAVFSKIAPKAAGKIAETIAKVAGKTPRILQAVGHASVEMGKEATEEALQTYLEPLVDSWVTGEEFEAPEFEEVVYSALLGAVTSGVLEGAPAVGKATVDTITGKPNLSADEQTVADRVAEYEIARREKAGETLTEKEKKQISEKVQSDMDKGYIPTEAIEAVLGGESYKTYRDTVTREDALRSEYEELGGLEKPTLAQQTRYQELHNSRDTFINDDMRNDLRSKAKDEVRNRVRGTRLEQSYLEADRKKEKFTADLSKYKDENERMTVENIVNSGLLDNTNKSHEIVDFLAKTSKDRKVTVEVTNNEKLKAEGKVYTFKKDITADGNTAVFSVGGRNIDKDFKPVVTVDGKAVTDFKVDYANGKITFASPVAADSVIHVEYQKVAAMNGSYEKGKRVITFNVDSEEAIQTTIGHELKHSFEGTEYEDEFNKAIVDYAKKVGTYDSLVEAVKDVYNDGTEIDSEVTAILTGEYITTDEEFVKYLSTNHRNVFEWLYDQIKHWLKMVTAGSKEARALEKAKHIYAKMYRAEVKVDADVKADGGEANFSIIGETKDGRRCYESGFSDEVSMDERIELFKERIATIFNLGAVELKTDVKKIQVRGDKFTAQKNLFGDKAGVEGEYTAKINALYDLADILATSKYDPSETNKETSYENPSVKPKNAAHKGVKYWYKFKNEIVFDGVPYTVTFNIRDKGAEQYQYLIDFKENKTPGLSNTAVKSLLRADQMSLSDSIAPIPENVNTQMSISSEGNGNQSTEEVKVLEGGTAVKYSISTWKPETKDKVRKNLVKAGYETERVDKWIEDLNGVASVIAADKDRLGFEAADNQVMLKNNQEYVKTLDASTLCAKRLQYQGTFDAIQHRLPNTVLTSDDLIELQNMLKEHGYEAPCSVCYVESRRRHLGKFAQEWLDGYEGEYKPNLDEVTTSDGLENLRHRQPQAYKDFVDAMNAKGSANPKVVQLRTEYRNDIMSLTKKQVEKIVAIGGLRIQSFSDFETPHLLDMMQAVMDMSAMELTSQAYTKVPNFAWVFGDTGIKINLSLIAEGNGFDSDGNLAFSSVEGMDINDAMAVRDAYSENVGTIIVGANDAHILACMADDRIDYIIPFHRSGWGKNEMEMMGLGSYEDYSYGQNEHDLATGKKVSNLYPPDYWDYNVSGKENAERYLKLCAQTGREPKFSNFLVNNGDGSYSLQPDGSTDGYWKTLIDFKMYDNEGNGVKQQKVQPNFNMEEAYRVLNEYEGGANSLPVANDVVEEFVAKHSDDIAPTPDVQYSLGYHAGDLGKAESLAQQGRYRGTGHFGTGTYFVGDESKISSGDYGKRPHHAVEFDNYDLYHIRNDKDGYELHEQLKIVDGGIREEWVESAVKDKFRLMSTTEAYEIAEAKYGEDNAYSTDAMVYGFTEFARKYGINIQSMEEYGAEEGYDADDEYLPDAYLEYLKETVRAEEKSINAAYREFANAFWSMKLRFDMSGEKVEKAFRDVLAYQNVMMPEGVRGENASTADSLATVFMKSLGYEGIDVRGSSLDNVEYGSVIYDLKGNDAQKKADIGTARFSLSNGGYPIKGGGTWRTPARDLRFEAPVREDIAPVAPTKATEAPSLADIPVLPDDELEDGTYEAVTPKREPKSQTPEQNAPIADTKDMFVDAPTKNPKKANWLNAARTRLLDDASVFEDLAKKTKNRELEAKFNFTKSAQARAQSLIGKGKKELGIKSLTSIHDAVKKTGKEIEFEDYMYHLLNIDRMTMSQRFGKRDIPVFDRGITADVSMAKVKQYQSENPEFKSLASEIYKYMRYERQLMVDGGLISQETADLWQKETPHYIPIKRAGYDDGFTKTLDSGKSIRSDSVVKKVVGGNQPMEHMMGVIAERTERVYSAIAKNSFGVELKNTLNTVIESETATQDDVDNGMDRHEDLLQKGRDGKNPTFTVFENGKKVTFEINNDMYEALKPTDPMWQGTSKVLGGLNDFRRGVLTEYSLPFIATNAIKDAQDVLMNSQHPVKTYGKIPVAIKELTAKGKWFTEYMENGGEQNTFFDKNSGSLGEVKDNWLMRNTLGRISQANNFIERIPRLAEYIASRENGASIEVAMLDAARVTTNFQAGGDITKWANRNGFTFLNASVQGAMQQVRNVREAKMNGLKGWAQLAAKTIALGLPSILLNSLLWDDDEEYEELSDYVKDNYYIVAKYDDGKFVRIPKGRTAAVIQNAFEQMGNLITGDDEVDLGRFTELVINNLAPANPLDNNVIAPIAQAISNKTWYGDDLVPTRLQDLPAEEQYDESTDSISKWLGENVGGSPYKWNYVIDQYSGGVGDIFLPWLTPEAERGDNSLIAPVADKFTTDSVMKNQSVTDFYTKKDELTIAANGSRATDEDILKSKYMNSVSGELGQLYQKKREIQNGYLSDTAKYEAVRELQKQIASLAKDSLESYSNVFIDGDYATIGNRAYRRNDEGEWQKLNDKQVQKQDLFTRSTSLSPSEYWKIYDEIGDIPADKDESGKSINGSRKEKVVDYLNNLDADYYTKIILLKSEYPSDDTYNYEIVEYINSRSDLTYTDRVNALTELGFRVTADGQIYVD